MRVYRVRCVSSGSGWWNVALWPYNGSLFVGHSGYALYWCLCWAHGGRFAHSPGCLRRSGVCGEGGPFGGGPLSVRGLLLEGARCVRGLWGTAGASSECRAPARAGRFGVGGMCAANVGVMPGPWFMSEGNGSPVLSRGPVRVSSLARLSGFCSETCCSWCRTTFVPVWCIALGGCVPELSAVLACR